MQDYLIEIIGGLIILLGSIGGSFLAARAAIARVPAQNDLDEQQATQAAVQSTKLLLEPLNERIKQLEAQVKLDKAEFDRKIEEMNGEYRIGMVLTVGKVPSAHITNISKMQNIPLTP